MACPFCRLISSLAQIFLCVGQVWKANVNPFPKNFHHFGFVVETSLLVEGTQTRHPYLCRSIHRWANDALAKRKNLHATLVSTTTAFKLRTNYIPNTILKTYTNRRPVTYYSYILEKMRVCLVWHLSHLLLNIYSFEIWERGRSKYKANTSSIVSPFPQGPVHARKTTIIGGIDNIIHCCFNYDLLPSKN